MDSRKLLERSAWYWNRLRRMSAREISARAAEWARAMRDRSVGPPSISAAGPCQAGSPEELRLPPLEKATFFGDLSRHFGRLSDAAWAYHRWIPIDSTRSFRTDPVSGDVFPDMFWRSIPIRGGYTDFEPRRVWEINRFHDIVQLSLAFTSTGDERYLREAARRISSWEEAFPYPRGIAWASSLEAGIRLMNLWVALSLAPSLAGHVGGDRLKRLTLQHMEHVRRYPSAHSSRGNHTLGEMVGIICGRAICGQVARRRELQVAAAEAARLLSPEREGFEESSHYLVFALEMGLLLRRVAAAMGFGEDSDLLRAMRAGLDLLAGFVEFLGWIPLLGDNDDGEIIRPLPAISSREMFVSTLMGLPAGMSREGRGEAADIAAMLKARILGDPGGFPAGSGSDPGVRQWPGIAMGRTTMGSSVVGWCMVSRRLGVPPLAGHGHCDALSLLLSVDSRPVFIDPGTYLYHSDRGHRAYLRSAAAHNTFRIEGRDFAETVGPFLYDRLYDAGMEDVRVGSEETRVAGWHDAYVKMGLGMARRVLSVRPREGRLVLEDSVVTDERMVRMEVRFHVHPACRLEAEGDRCCRVETGERKLLLRFSPEMKVEIARAGSAGNGGWWAPEYSTLEPCWTIVARGEPRTTRTRTEVVVQ